jgi:hypothetical protein
MMRSVGHGDALIGDLKPIETLVERSDVLGKDLRPAWIVRRQEKLGASEVGVSPQQGVALIMRVRAMRGNREGALAGATATSFRTRSVSKS